MCGNEEERIGLQIRIISNLMKRRVDRNTREDGVDHVTATHGWVIRYFRMNEGKDVFQRDLEKAFSIRRPTATGILQLMEKNGLIVREPVPYDARLKKITLTEKAIAMDDLIEKEILRTEEELQRGMSEEEVHELLRLLAKLRKNME